MDLAGRMVLLAIVLALGAAGTWLLHSTDWPPFIVFSLDSAVWAAIGSSAAGLFGSSGRTERDIVRQLRSRAPTTTDRGGTEQP